ncbi:MAG: hypothetical protein RLY66_526 [Candidatus Parcubacteria bacterium]|jgi:hypothetical protein
MKKFLIASGVAVLAFASVAAAQGTAFNTNLTVGSTGSDVVALQSWLIANGYSIPSIASGAAAKGYFGSQTKAAVQAYQAARGIPSTGFVGPLTRGALNAGGAVVTLPSAACPVGMICTPVGGGSPVVSTGGLAGTDGNISDVQALSQYSNEEVGDGQSDVKIVGLEVEASNDGDIALKSVNLTFDGSANTSTASKKLVDYVETVSIWKGSTKIGSADASAFNKDSTGVYSKTLSLSGDTVVRADKKEKFYIAIDSVSNLDSTDIANDFWTVDVNNIRFEDGSGVVTSDDTTGDLGGSLDNVALSFVSFSTAADTELKISTDSSTPDADLVTVDDTDNTDDVLLLVGKMKLEGTSDVTIDALRTTLTSTGNSIAGITNSLKLVLGGEEYSETVSSTTAGLSGSGTSGTITFDNLDFDISAGSTVTFKVYADINDLETNVFAGGDTLKASLTSTDRGLIDAENEEGDQLAAGEKTGSATGEAQEFRTDGVALTLISTTAGSTAGQSSSDDLATFTIKFKVKAIGDTVYVASLAGATLSGTANVGASVIVDRAGTATVGGTSVTIIDNTDTDLTAAGNYMIEDGEEHSFTLTTTAQLPAAGSAGQFRAALAGIDWDTDDDATPDNVYTSNLDNFKTDYIGLN